MTWTRVRDRDTGHEYDIDDSTFDPDLHARVNAPKGYPDLHGPGQAPRPIKHRVSKDGTPPGVADDDDQAGLPATDPERTT